MIRFRLKNKQFSNIKHHKNKKEQLSESIAPNSPRLKMYFPLPEPIFPKLSSKVSSTPRRSCLLVFLPSLGGGWQLAAGWWLVAGGRWLVAAGWWLVAAGCWLVSAGSAGGCWLVA